MEGAIPAHVRHQWPTRVRVAVALVVVVAAGLYFSGRMDRALYGVGLNFHTCAENGFGAVFCGRALTDYQQRVQRGIQQGQQAAQQATQSLRVAECRADPALAGCP